MYESLNSVPATDAQRAYIRRLQDQMGAPRRTPRNKAHASVMIDEYEMAQVRDFMRRCEALRATY